MQILYAFVMQKISFTFDAWDLTIKYRMAMFIFLALSGLLSESLCYWILNPKII
jgi:hypothetical protein